MIPPAPQAAPPQAGPLPPQGAVPPALLAALQARQGGQPAPGPAPGPQPPQPPMQPGAMPPPGTIPNSPPSMPPAAPPTGIPTPGMQVPPRLSPPGASAPGMAAFARSATGQGGGQPRLTPSEMAALGRHGDTIVAHLTPGEIAIPKELQTPEVMNALGQATRAFGISPAMLQAGSPHASRNPATGAEEHSFWSSILPMAAMGATAFFAPELLPAEWGALGTAAATGLAGFGTGLLTGMTPGQALFTGAGGALGAGIGSAGSGLGAAAGSGLPDTGAINAEAAATAASDLPTPPIPTAEGMAAAGISPATDAATTAASTATKGPFGALGALLPKSPWGLAMMGGGLASTLSDGLNPPTSLQNSSALPANFNNKAPAPTVDPNWGALLHSQAVNRPTFANYNPFLAATQTGFNFFPTQGINASTPAVQPIAPA